MSARRQRSCSTAASAGGQAGVELALDLIGKELSTTMGLTGINHISEIDRRVLTDHLQTNA
jgi:L-lactate dehydrogenase (cytochrome)